MADKNFLSFANRSHFSEIVGNVIPDASDYADALKLSNCTDCSVTAETIVGGREDCVDINRGFNVHVHAETYCPRGKFVFTVKGGADEIYLSGELDGHGTEADVDLGNWSDQAQGRTKRVYLSLTTKDGSPVRVRVLHGWRPVILNPSQRYDIDVKAKGVFGVLMGFLKKLKIA